MFKDLRSPGLLAAGAGLMLAGLVGCPSYTFLEVLPERVTENQIIVEPGKPVPADILFVVDNSCSMEDEQNLLAANFNAFIDELTKANADYRIGVVTTDLSSTDGQARGRERIGKRVSEYQNAPPNKLTGINESDCRFVDIEHGCFAGPSPEFRVVTSAMAGPDQILRFGENVKVGSCGSGTEEGLAGMVAGLRRATTGDCNDNFLRPGANLVIVIVSDEDDQSLASRGSQYLQDLTEIKPLSQIRFAAIVGANVGANGAEAARCAQRGGACGGACDMYGPRQGSLNSCQGGCPSGEVCEAYLPQCVQPDYQYWTECGWCSFYNTPDCCSALAGNIYLQFAKNFESALATASGGDISATGCVPSTDPEIRVGCLVDSICQESFSQTLKRIATDLVIVPTVNLNPPATYPPGVVVTVNGVELENGVDYTISEDGGTLRYAPGKTPGTGDVVEVFYTIPE